MSRPYHLLKLRSVILACFRVICITCVLGTGYGYQYNQLTNKRHNFYESNPFINKSVEICLLFPSLFLHVFVLIEHRPVTIDPIEEYDPNIRELDSLQRHLVSNCQLRLIYFTFFAIKYL